MKKKQENIDQQLLRAMQQYDASLNNDSQATTDLLSQMAFWLSSNATFRSAVSSTRPLLVSQADEEKASVYLKLALRLAGSYYSRLEVKQSAVRPPLNAEYVLYLFLRREEREAVIGDLVESYDRIVRRFNKRRGDIWFYKQVIGSVFPLARRTFLRIAGLVWLGRIFRRLIS